MSGKFCNLISYFIDLNVEKKNSKLSGPVAVALSRGEYKLSTENAIYSYGKNYTSFAGAFHTLDVLHREIENVLILGFGLGSVVDLLEKNTSIQKITAVDADDVI